LTPDRASIVEKLEEEYNRSWWAWEKLERHTFESDYQESFEDTLERKYQEGYSEAIAKTLKLLKEEER
jgi:hypothetical protein